MFKRILAFFGLTTLEEAKDQYNKGVLNERDRVQEMREDIELGRLRSLMNKPVIGVSNEWENPIIGIMVDIEFITKARNPVPVIRDALTGKEHIALCKVMPLTMQRFSAIMKLTPYERWCLIDNQNCIEHRGDEENLPKVYSLEEMTKALENKGFFAYDK